MKNFNFICDRVDNGIIILDKNLNVKFWNDWLVRRTNITSKAIIDNNLDQFFSTLNINKLKRKINATLKLNTSTFYNTEVNKYLLEIKLKRITSRIFEYMQQGVTIVPYDIDKDLVVIYIYDNTLLAETSQNLQILNSKLKDKNDELSNSKLELEDSISEVQLLLNTTMEGIFLFQDEICLRYNEKAKELFFKGHHKDTNKIKISDLIHEESQSLIFNIFDKPFELKMLRLDKTFFYALVQVKIMQINNKSLKVLSILDLTDIKEKDRLLAEQSKLAAMGEMLGNIAHQWRQPLSTISTAASGLKLQSEFGILKDDSFKDGMDEIVRSSQHLSQTIEDFKDFLRGDKEKIFFNLKENIQKNIQIVAGLLKSESVKLTLSCDDDIQLLNYPNELTQAVLNIITNAKDALLNKQNRQNRYIFINVFLEDGSVIIEIKDNGKGIESKILNKIFEPYFTTKHKEQGTGLGLYMTHQIIEQSMKGSIRAYNANYIFKNKEEKGACFRISLPFAN